MGQTDERWWHCCCQWQAGTSSLAPLSCCFLLTNSPVLGNVVSAECWDFDFCLPSGLSLVAGTEETKGLESGLGVAFEGWELATVKPGVT